MFTFDEAPWVEYLEIDEATRERRLRDDTPDDIRKKYEEHCNKQRQFNDEVKPK